MDAGFLNVVEIGQYCMTKDSAEFSEFTDVLAKNFGKGQWSLIGQVPRRSDILWKRIVHKEFWIISRKRRCWNLLKVDCPIFRATTPLSRGKLKSKGHGKLSIHFAADQQIIEIIFRIIVFAYQLSLYGAVANMCEEYETLHDRSGRPDVVMGQSIVLSAIKTEVPLGNDDPAYQNFLLQQYEERIEKLSQQDRLSIFCMDAGFLSVVAQFHAVACREYILPRDDGSSQPRGWIQGNTKIGPVLEVFPSYLHGKHRVEIRVKSLSRDNTDSWVRFLMDLINL